MIRWGSSGCTGTATSCGEPRQLRCNAVRPQILEQSELRRPGALGALIGEIEDGPLPAALYGAVRIIDEACQPFRKPVIAARLTAAVVHALLHDGPLPVIGDDEAVQIEVEAVLHRGAVDLGDQAADAGQFAPVDADAVADRQQLGRRLTRVPAAPAADADAEFALERSEPALERANDAGGDARRMPIHAHDGAERLEPEGARQPPQQFLPAIVMHDRLRDDRAESGHAVGEPGRHASTMQRQISGSGAARHTKTPDVGGQDS